jgi:isopenicillin-N N-acyltransferase-like protein
MLCAHTNGPNAVCSHLEDSPEYLLRAATLASIIMDLRTPRFLVSDGQPCTAPYEEIALPVPVAQ